MRALLLLLAFAVQSAAAPQRVVSQESSMRGTFVVDRQASDNVNQKIQTAVSRIPSATRQVTLSRLLAANPAYQRVVLSYTSEQVSIGFDQRAPMVSPANGSPVRWTREDGERFDLSTGWQGRALIQTLRGEDGSRVNTFSVSPDGRTLTLNVVQRSSRLSQPLAYRLVFRRAS